jgi:hypothetical protein
MGNVETFLHLYRKAVERSQVYESRGIRTTIVACIKQRMIGKAAVQTCWQANIWSVPDSEWSRLFPAQRQLAIDLNPSIRWRYNL